MRTSAAVCVVAVVLAACVLHARHSPIASAAVPLDTPHVEGASIAFSPGFAERVGLRTVPAASIPLDPVVNAVGTLDFDPAYVAAVGARCRGFVTRVMKFEGDGVEPGSVLAALDSPELGQAQASILTLDAERRAAESNLARESALAMQRLSTEREAELAAVEAERYENQLRAARRKVAALGGPAFRSSGRLGRHELRSPVKGTIVACNVAMGQTVRPDLVAFRIADPEHLWVELDVYEKNLVRVQVGDRVELTPLADKKKRFEGRVARVSPQIDPTTRSAPVRVEIPNRSGKMRAGQAVSASIRATARSHGAVTVVPTSSITLFDGKPTVFVRIDAGVVRVVPVETGVTNGTETEVRRGVAPGDQVVSAGVFSLKSELFR